jgi:glycosyltransferase involved in cell wall biosynthesis
MGQILSSMNFIVALSYAEAVDLHTLFRVPSELMQVVPHIIPEAEPATNDESLEELTGRSPYFVTISRIDRRKNVIAAVRAASLAGARLFIVGQDGGELRTVLREISRAAPSGSRYLGILPEATKSWLLARSMALVIPSYFEGLPVVTLEARRLGTRVISTRLSYAPPMDEVYTCDPTPRGIADQMKAIERLPSHPVPAVLPSKEEVATRYAELFSNY